MKMFGKADTLKDKSLSCSRIKHSNSQAIIVDGVDTGVLLLDFTQQSCRKNLHVPHLYFTLLDAAGISPSLMKQNETKDSQEAFSSMITKKNRQKKVWIDKGTEFAGALKS